MGDVVCKHSSFANCRINSVVFVSYQCTIGGKNIVCAFCNLVIRKKPFHEKSFVLQVYYNLTQLCCMYHKALEIYLKFERKRLNIHCGCEKSVIHSKKQKAFFLFKANSIFLIKRKRENNVKNI